MAAKKTTKKKGRRRSALGGTNVNTAKLLEQIAPAEADITPPKLRGWMTPRRGRR